MVAVMYTFTSDQTMAPRLITDPDQTSADVDDCCTAWRSCLQGAAVSGGAESVTLEYFALECVQYIANLRLFRPNGGLQGTQTLCSRAVVYL